MNILVSIKRVPGASGRITLTDDAQAVDARHVGYTLSPHEECAVELAVQTVEAHGGAATVLSVGIEDVIDQMRDALSVGIGSGILVETDASTWAPGDVAHAIADVVTTHEATGQSYDLLLFGNEAADTGDFQVGIAVAHRLGLPCVTGVKAFEVTASGVTARRDGPDGVEVFELTLPAVLTVRDGAVIPRYPSVPGRIKAKRAPIERLTPSITPVGNGRIRLTVPPEVPSRVEVLGQGADAAAAAVDLFERLGLVTR